MTTILIFCILGVVAGVWYLLSRRKCSPSIWLERWVVERDLDE